MDEIREDSPVDGDLWWKSEFQYLLNNKILSRDELAYLFGQIKSIIEKERLAIRKLIESRIPAEKSVYTPQVADNAENRGWNVCIAALRQNLGGVK